MRGAIDELNECLSGSPYLLDDDEAGRKRAEFLHDESSRVRDRQAAVQSRFEAESLEIRQRVEDMVEARLVYESNALELTGLPLAETSDAIRDAGNDLPALAQYTTERVVQGDQHLVEVLGLHRAMLFARQLAGEYRDASRPIQEVDIRTLHAATVEGAEHAGTYRSDVVTISGSDHKPPEFIDVPRQMHELVVWLNETAAPPSLAATVVHSWLTIIHPFVDGNGRVARLLANVVLLRADFPPLVVRASDRLQYLDALSASDSGGNLLPLFDLFVKSIKRGLKELERPDLARRLFEADLKRYPDQRYELWSRQITAFLNTLRAELPPYGMTLDRLAVPDTSTFLLLEDGDASGNTWLAKLKHPDGRDFLLWLGFMTHEMRDNHGRARSSPSIFISERDRRPEAVHPYANPFRLPSRVAIDEVSLIPQVGGEEALLRYGITVIGRTIEEAASAVASAIGGLDGP